MVKGVGMSVVVHRIIKHSGLPKVNAAIFREGASRQGWFIFAGTSLYPIYAGPEDYYGISLTEEEVFAVLQALAAEP